MRRSQSKSHTISQGDSTWTLALPAFFVLVLLASIVLLCVLAESASMEPVHAEENAAPAQSQQSAGLDMFADGPH